MELIRCGNNTNWCSEMERDDADALKRNEEEVWSGFDVDAYEEREDWDSPEHEKLSEEYGRREDLMYEFEPMRYFDVISHGPYHLEIERVTIEDVGEMFYDTTDLLEMGIRNDCGFYVDKPKMGRALGEQISMIPKGRASVDIDDLHLLDLMKEHRISPADLGHQGFNRRGNKIARPYSKPPPPPPPPQDKPRHKNWLQLCCCVHTICEEKFSILLHADDDDADWDDDWLPNRVKALAVFKKLVLWKEMDEEITERELDKDHRKWIKQIWSKGEFHFENMDL